MSTNIENNDIENYDIENCDIENTTIKDYKKLIHENENLLLNNYKDLVVSYQECTETYDALVKEYETILGDDNLEETEPTIIQCSELYGYNRAGVVTRWGLFDLDGTQLFVSDRHPKNEVYTLNLTELYLTPHTQLRFKAVVSAGDDSTSKEIIEYVPDSHISAYYKLTGTAFHTSLNLELLIPNDL